MDRKDVCISLEKSTRMVEFGTVIKRPALRLSRTRHGQRFTWLSGQMFVLQMEADSCAVAGQ